MSTSASGSTNEFGEQRPEAEAGGEVTERNAGFGEWSWLTFLPDEDRQEFVRELGDEIITAVRADTAELGEPVERAEAALYEWRATAQALADPVRRAVLLGRPGPGDFVEVGRPE